jgi:hypothetical protein
MGLFSHALVFNLDGEQRSCKRGVSSSAAAALVAAILPLQAAQAAVIYAFETFTRGLGDPYLASFSYIVPGFITSNTLIPTPADCAVTMPLQPSCGPTQRFYADSTPLAGLDAYDAVEFSPEVSNYY